MPAATQVVELRIGYRQTRQGFAELFAAGDQPIELALRIGPAREELGNFLIELQANLAEMVQPGSRSEEDLAGIASAVEDLLASFAELSMVEPKLADEGA